MAQPRPNAKSSLPWWCSGHGSAGPQPIPSAGSRCPGATGPPTPIYVYCPIAVGGKRRPLVPFYSIMQASDVFRPSLPLASVSPVQTFCLLSVQWCSLPAVAYSGGGSGWWLFPPAGGNSPSWTPQVLRVQWVWCSLWWPESQHPSPSGGSSVSGLARQWIDHRPAPLQLCNPNPSPGLGLPPPTSVHFLYIWTPSPLLTVSPDRHRWGLGPGFFKSEDPLTFHDAQRCGHFGLL